jgi:hypothetical protein
MFGARTVRGSSVYLPIRLGALLHVRLSSPIRHFVREAVPRQLLPKCGGKCNEVGCFPSLPWWGASRPFPFSRRCSPGRSTDHITDIAYITRCFGPSSPPENCFSMERILGLLCLFVCLFRRPPIISLYTQSTPGSTIMSSTASSPNPRPDEVAHAVEQ